MSSSAIVLGQPFAHSASESIKKKNPSNKHVRYPYVTQFASRGA